jgi:hypothetical protein
MVQYSTYIVCGGSEPEAAEEAEKSVEEREGNAHKHGRRCIHVEGRDV